MRATTCENFPAGFLAVPLNMRCSRKWAKPDLPGVSSAAPTLYQIMCVTTGARWSGMTTSSNPLASVKLAISGPACWAASGEAASAAASAMVAKFILASTMLTLGMLRSCGSTSWMTSPALRTKRDSDGRHILPGQLTACGVAIRRLRRCCFAEAIGLIRGRGLVARRRIGQRRARRFACELCRFFLFPTKHRVPHGARAGAKLRREQLIAEAGGRRLITVVGTHLLFLWGSAGSQLILAQRILLTFALVADVAVLLRGCFGLTARHVRILRPCRIIGSGSTDLLGRRQFAARWKHKRRAFLVVDRCLAIALETKPVHDAAHYLLIDRSLIIGRACGAGQHQRGRAERQPEGGAYAEDIRQTHHFHPEPDLELELDLLNCCD